MRYALRSLRRTPLVTATAIFSIAVGIAAATAVFSIVDAALWRPPPLPDAGRLAVLFITRERPGERPGRERWSWNRVRALAAGARSFAGVASFSAAELTLTGDVPEPVDGEIVSASYWAVLRREPAVGRAFTPDEDLGGGAHPVTIVAHNLWIRRYGGDSSLVGRSLRVNGVPLTVVGIAPPGFNGLTGHAQLWIPPGMAPLLTYADYLATNQNFISAVGRLRPGVSLAEARAELQRLGAAIDRALPSRVPDDGSRFAADAVTLNEARIDSSTRRPMLLLLGGALCLLLLACANVAGLLLGRGVSHRREIAIRLATGASRARVTAHLLLQSALIAAVGGVLGTLAAFPTASHLTLPAALASGRNFYGALGEFAAPRADARVLAFCVLVTAATTFAFGLLPARAAARLDLASALKEGGGTTAGRGRVDARQIIVGVEAALAVVLLVLGAAFGASWRRFERTDVGFQPEHVITFAIRPSEVEYPPSKAPALLDRLLASLEAVPGVVAATVDGCAPLGTRCASTTLFIAGRATVPDDAPLVLRHYVGPDHFRALGVPLLRGRVFDARDRAGSPPVVVISATAGRRFWPGDDPIGKRVWFGSGTGFDRADSSAVVVGVVGDVAYQPLDANPVQADFYTPYRQFTYASRTVLVRVRGDARAIVPALRRAAVAADPALALVDVRTMRERMRDSWSRVSFQTTLFGAYAGVALVLAAAGIFAVIVHAVATRRREIGVRMALGASRARILSTVGRAGARPAAIGAAAGLVAALLALRVLRSLFHGIEGSVPVVVAGVCAATAVVILAASYLAARRALGVEPIEVLRQQ